MMQLKINFNQGLLDVLLMRGEIAHDDVSLPKIGPELCNTGIRLKACSNKAIAVELLEPLRIIDISLSAWYIFGVTSIDQKDFNAMSHKYFV